MPADLMAAARRRLPPEVDVVALPRLAGGLLAGAVAITGCAPSPSDARAQTAESKAHVRHLAGEVLGAAGGAGAYPKPPRGRWTSCDDLGGKVGYLVSARLDPAPGDDRPLLDEVRARLGDTGVTLRPVGAADGDPVTMQGDRDDVRVQVTGYVSRPLVLLELAGPCLDVGDLDADLLAEPPEAVDAG